MKVIKRLIIKWLNKIFCTHEWEVYKQIKTRHYWNSYDEDYYKVTNLDILICKKCGKIKKVKY